MQPLTELTLDFGLWDSKYPVVVPSTKRSQIDMQRQLPVEINVEFRLEWSLGPKIS